MTISQVTVTGAFSAPNGLATGSVSFSLAQAISDGSGTSVAANVAVVAPLVDGTFTARLNATDDPTTLPQGVKYTATFNVNGATWTRTFALPRGTSPIDISTLAPLPGAVVYQGASSLTPFVKTPNGWNAHYLSSLATIATAPVGVLFDGDSIANGGTQVTNPFTQAWAYTVITALQARSGYGSYGRGLSPWGCTFLNGSADASGALGGYVANANAPFSALTNTGNQLYQTDDGIFGRAIESKSTAGTFQTITTAAGTTGFDLVFSTVNPSGTFTITVDGVALPAGATATGVGITYSAPTITYTNHGPNGWNINPVDKLLVRGLTAGVHTIVITNNNAAHGLIFGWYNEYYGTPGGIMGCVNGCSGGLGVDLVQTGTASNYNLRGVMPSFRDRLWTGGVDGINGTNKVYLSSNPFGYPTGCDLILDGMFVNDVSGGVSIAAFKSAKSRKYRAMRRAMPNCSIITIIPSYPDSITSDNIIVGRGQLAALYKQASYDVAAEYNAAVVDIDAAWGPNGVSLGFQLAGDLHPTVAGHADIAARVLTIL